MVGTAALLGAAAACQTAISREAEDAPRHARAPAQAGPFDHLITECRHLVTQRVETLARSLLNLGRDARSLG
jgi:hypothetical protein